MDPSHPPSPVVIIISASFERSNSIKAHGFEGLPMFTYSLGRQDEIFQLLEAEARQTPMLLPEVIKIAKGEA